MLRYQHLSGLCYPLLFDFFRGGELRMVLGNKICVGGFVIGRRVSWSS